MTTIREELLKEYQKQLVNNQLKIIADLEQYLYDEYEFRERIKTIKKYLSRRINYFSENLDEMDKHITKEAITKIINIMIKYLDEELKKLYNSNGMFWDDPAIAIQTLKKLKKELEK